MKNEEFKNFNQDFDGNWKKFLYMLENCGQKRFETLTQKKGFSIEIENNTIITTQENNGNVYKITPEVMKKYLEGVRTYRGRKIAALLTYYYKNI